MRSVKIISNMEQSHNDSDKSQIDENHSKINPRKVFNSNNCFWLRILREASKHTNSYCNPINGFPNDILNYLKSYVCPLIRETNQTVMHKLNVALPNTLDPYLSLLDKYEIQSGSNIVIANKFVHLVIRGWEIKYMTEHPNKNKTKKFIQKELTKIFPNLEIVSSEVIDSHHYLHYNTQINTNDVYEKAKTLDYNILKHQGNRSACDTRARERLGENNFMLNDWWLSINTIYGYLVIHKDGNISITTDGISQNLKKCIRIVDGLIWC